MRNKDYFKTSILELLREKKKIGYSLTIIICTILMFSVLFFYDILNKLIYSTINNQIGYRMISVFPRNRDEIETQEELRRIIDKDIIDIMKIDNVLDVFNGSNWSTTLNGTLKKNNLEGSFTLIRGKENTLPNVKVGRSFKNNENKVAICPKVFTPTSDSIYIDKNNWIDGEELIGSKLEVEYYDYVLDNFLEPVENNNYKKEFEIVGIYDTYERLDEGNTCYISSYDMKEITDTINSYNDSYIPAIGVIIDEVENVDKVSKQLKEIGFDNPQIGAHLDTKVINIFKTSIILITTIVLITVLLTSASFAKKKIKLEEKDIGILRANGYSKKDIMIINVLKMIINNTILFIIGGIIFTIVALVIVRNVSLLLTLNIMLNGLMLSMKSFVLAFLFIVLFPTLILLLYMHKCLKNKIVCLIRSEE